MPQFVTINSLLVRAEESCGYDRDNLNRLSFNISKVKSNAQNNHYQDI